jgi:murein L,D-transpeptidase YcbB/YkuD
MRLPCNRSPLAMRALLALIVGVLLLAAPSGASAQFLTAGADAAAIRQEVADLLAKETTLPLPIKQRRAVLSKYYADKSSELLWLSSLRGRLLVLRMTDAAADGLARDDYPAAQLTKLLDSAAVITDRRSLAIVELHFSAAFLEYASDLSIGRFLPSKIDPDFFLKARTFDDLAALKAVAADPSLDNVFDRLAPRGADYAWLKVALAAYRAAAVTGGWGKVPLGASLKPGATDTRVPALRARLAITDGADPQTPAAKNLYDAGLVEAVKRFQARHGLDVDGVAGPGTLVALNVPIEERIDQIVMAMERWRWMPPDLGAHYVIVNIAGFELRRIENGVIREKMAVVVGKPANRTPVFSDVIRYVEFNPTWTVPATILANEELAKLKRDPAGMAAQGFEAISGGRAYDVRSIDWNSYSGDDVPFQLRQKPGPNNALGQVKIMFPNSHDIYLHDTPAQSLFDRADRAFSHGCIRLDRPFDLALQVLAAGGVPGWDQRRIDALVATNVTTVVNLATPLPVHITYLTAWVDNGVVSFAKDVYGHDAKLLAALNGKALAW